MSMKLEQKVAELEAQVRLFRKATREYERFSTMALTEQDKRIEALEKHRDIVQNRPPFPLPPFPKKLRELGLGPPES